ncbi:MAG TPA: nitrogen fixation protein NifZ [Bradyrhizobium sp.]|nr:nitrogen fixation protein NifZ [Bradyrhizobium sp.]
MNTAARARRETIGRIVHHAHLRQAARSSGSDRTRAFRAGEHVRSVALVKNDGMYPHREIGEGLVHSGDLGIVRECWCFLGDTYYTVEFVARAVVVIMRGREMVPVGETGDSGS